MLEDYINAKINKAPERFDNAPVKRVELSCSTKMGGEGLASAADYIKRAAESTLMAFRMAWFKAHHPEAFNTAVTEVVR